MGGMPKDLTVYEPRITYDGTTTTMTYTVSVSDWSKDLLYTAQKASGNAGNAEPQSIEALIWWYGGEKSLLVNDEGEPVSSFAKGASYKLKTKTDDGDEAEDLPHYVIIPLDTSRIREELRKKLVAGAKEDTAQEDAEGEDTDTPSLVWIEENPAIGIVETVSEEEDTANWTNGTYEDEGIRIGGFYEAESTEVNTQQEDEPVASRYKISTIENFDDGEENRIRSIATVLADGTDRDKQRYVSKINFYAGSNATAIATGVRDNTLNNTTSVRQWMKYNNKPVLCIVYKWAD
jgi:hypothetical protein